MMELIKLIAFDRMAYSDCRVGAPSMVAWFYCFGPVVSTRRLTDWEAERNEWIKFQDSIQEFTSQ